MKDCKKVVLITGASSGIGLATAKFLTQKGFKVYGTARQELESDEDFSFLKADVNNESQMAQVLEHIFQTEGRLDCVINNAGIGISGAIEFAKKSDVEKIFNTNVIAVVNICSLSIPYLRLSGSGKIINISSVGGPIALPFQACYSSTKMAVEAFSLALRNEVRDFNIKVSCIRPGDTKTGFTKAREAKSVKVDNVYNDRVVKSIKKMEKDEQNGANPICVSKKIYKILKRNNPPPVCTVGFMYKLVVVLNKLLPVRLVNGLIKKIYG